MLWTEPVYAQSCQFHRTLSVAAKDPVTLDVHLAAGELQVVYGRDEQVSITIIREIPAGVNAEKESLAAELAIEQDRNHLRIRHRSNAGPPEGLRTVYRIDVPYQTEVCSVVDKGKQTITGIMGPVKAGTVEGDITVSYISKGVRAEARAGNLAFEVIGERVEATTGSGNISCTRALQGVSAETGEGDVVFVVVGPSKAIVKKGTGRIDVGGARSSFWGSTSGGDLHIKAMPHDDWKLSSASGTIRIELPPKARFEVDATTSSGELLINRDDIQKPLAKNRRLHQKVNGGGNQIEVQTDSGNIIFR